LEDPASKKLVKEAVERKTAALIKKSSLPEEVAEQLRPRGLMKYEDFTMVRYNL
jgi:hypothetical protein